MSDVIVVDKSKLKSVGMFVGAAALALVAAYVVKKKLPKASGFEVVSIERPDAGHSADRDTVILKDGTKINSIGFQLKSHGVLVRDPDHGALVMSGLECQDCGAIESLMIFALPDARTIQLAYPGQVYDPPSGDKTEGELAQESRVFYGECVADSGPVLVTWTNSREADGNFKQRMSVMGFRDDGSFAEIGHEEAPFQIGELVKSAEKHCKEIAGKTFRH